MSLQTQPASIQPSAMTRSDETVRCFECRQLWPRQEMRWGTRATGPVWLSKQVRVMRCPDCLPL